jgi:hypothetical protein
MVGALWAILIGASVLPKELAIPIPTSDSSEAFRWMI